jgi:hypothetical protein
MQKLGLKCSCDCFRGTKNASSQSIREQIGLPANQPETSHTAPGTCRFSTTKVGSQLSLLKLKIDRWVRHGNSSVLIQYHDSADWHPIFQSFFTALVDRFSVMGGTSTLQSQVKSACFRDLPGILCCVALSWHLIFKAKVL